MTSTSSGLTMLTTGVSQYLHPDYLQPLPTTLDAKKSPLALLAQTCSAIGKDSSPSKSIIPPLEKKDNNNDKTSDKSFDSESSKRPGSHGNTKESGRDSKTGFRSYPPKEIPPLVPISAHNGEKTTSLPGSEPKSSSPSGPVGASVPSSCPSSTPPSSTSSSRPLSTGSHTTSAPRTTSRGSTGKSEPGESVHHHPSHHHHPSREPSSQHAHHHRSRESPISSISSSQPSAPSPSYSKPSSSGSTPVMTPSSTSVSSSGAIKPSATHPAALGGLHPHLFSNPLALMGHGLDPTSPGFHSALAAAHSSLSSYSAAAAAQSSALKAAAAANGPGGISPYVTYAQVRTPSGATTLVPVCRDPFCTYCQQTLQNSHLSSNCTAPGCAQCAHEKTLTSLSALGMPGGPSSSMLLPPFSGSSSSLSTMSALSSLHSLYPHSALAAAHRQGLPYACSWISGSDYCGKRFASPEELLQHWRTHTASLDASSLAASYAGLGLPSALAAYHPHLASPAPLSPNSLRRNYPTSLSPVGSLLGANRYHPYKSPLSGVGATPPTPQNFPPVGPYYSPYALYGQRLGAVVP